ncbi:hypothetical protein D9Q98_006513 [Chlorella vulgaris]|uniref:Uncharacterized protein n=1 Tax=Chlorella vulgaris TaxID=3077 RepID=A0A9D4YVE1_CHLVU|nr:hypothetical protein D9Q98_006513 [Chlorella vulgaris]
MPRHFSDFVRNSPLENLRPLGTRTAAPQPRQQYGAAVAPQSYTSGSATAILYPPSQDEQPPEPPVGGRA